ncbi:MAG: hypothetical protein B6I18_01005 [Bacteroidetes bacterium 4572_112]|nr:MAG: hypothetical protein B6I18_01005 [Bacteroidetes bacterium 4572_112]
MIQRVQTIYLALVFILIAIMSFLPVVVFNSGDVVFYMNIFRFEGVNSLDFVGDLPNIWALPIAASLLAIISAFSIFKFKNRKQQMTLNMIAMLMNFILLAGIFYYSDMVAKMDAVTSAAKYDVAAFFPIVTVLLLILANRNIRKDEKLVRESERLR